MEKNILKIYGASDDLIEFEGIINDEIGCYDNDCKIELSDKTTFTIFYNDVGLWEIKDYAKGFLSAEITPPNIEKDETGSITIACGENKIYAICKIGNTINCFGDFILGETHRKLYNQLKLLFADVEEFEEREKMVEAILCGIKIY